MAISRECRPVQALGHHLLCLLAVLSAPALATLYSRINGLQCLRIEFVETHTDVLSKVECASLCDRKITCQVFSVADGPCQLFVFHRCSKYVRDCSCSRRVHVFVKQQSGLPPGAMCPAGFTDDLCGTKYKFYGGIQNWTAAKAATDAEPGLTIMADVTDATEMAHLKAIFTRDSLVRVFLGGLQAPGSPEPAGGWSWVSCNTNISSSLWSSGEPNNGGIENECVIAAGTGVPYLIDCVMTYSGAFALGECVSPFD